MGDIGDSYGMITAEWFGDELSDFMYTFDDDADGDFISRGYFRFSTFSIHSAALRYNFVLPIQKYNLIGV